MRRLLELILSVGLIIAVIVSVFSVFNDEWAKASYFLLVAIVCAGGLD